MSEKKVGRPKNEKKNEDKYNYVIVDDGFTIQPFIKEIIDEELHELNYKKNKVYSPDVKCYKVTVIWYYENQVESYRDKFHNIDAVIDFYIKITNDLLKKDFKKWVSNSSYSYSPFNSPEKNYKICQEIQLSSLEFKKNQINYLEKVINEKPDLKVSCVIFKINGLSQMTDEDYY